MERPDTTKLAISAILFLFLIFLGTQIYTYRLKAAEARKGYEAAETRLREAETSNAELAAELEYFAHPENMEKEVRARFNYREPGEKTLILVPQGTTTIQ